MMNTATNVVRPKTPATVPRRLVALAADYLGVACYAMLLVPISLAMGAGAGGTMDRLFANPLTAQALGFVTLTLPVWLYFALSESSAWRATIGKRLLGLEVVDSDGGRLTWRAALIRGGAKLLPWEISHGALRHIPGWPAEMEVLPAGVMIALGIAWLLPVLYVVSGVLDPANRTVYDRLARSEVIRS